MDQIIKKLLAGGVSSDIVEQLKAGLGNTFETELITNGLKVAAEKIGIDTADLPNIDFRNLSEATQELMGKDVDGDGKTGIAEAMENVQEAFKHSDTSSVQDFTTQKPKGWFATLKNLLGI